MKIIPFAHQVTSIKHAATTDNVLDFSCPGTGKTYVAIAVFAQAEAKEHGCALVLAPRSLLRSVWKNDFKKFAPHLTVSVADAAKRAEAFAAESNVYVTNTDAVKWLATQKPAFFKKFTDLIIDEGSSFKHHTSQRSKAMAKIAKYFKRRRLMTGTPNSNTITDIWHITYILDGGQRLGNSFFRFRDAVCTPHQVGRSAQMVKWHDKEGAEEVVMGLLSDIVIRHKFEECVDIPPNHQYSVEYDLTAKQLKAYFELEATQMLLLGGSKPAMLAINAAAVATKLLQVASGAVYDGLGSFQVIDTARYEMVLDLVEQRKHSLVFFLWKHQRDALVAEADKRGVKYRVLDGGTSDRDRDEIVRGYQAGVYQTIFAHPKSAAHGLTLTKGTATIWSSPTYDLEIFKQGSKRQHRMGQTQKTETIVVIAKNTIEEKVWELLQEKDKRMTNLLDLFGTLNREPATPVRRKKVAVAV